jgi:hypothetical protein
MAEPGSEIEKGDFVALRGDVSDGRWYLKGDKEWIGLNGNRK